jgi:hypothetical protein
VATIKAKWLFLRALIDRDENMLAMSVRPISSVTMPISVLGDYASTGGPSCIPLGPRFQLFWRLFLRLRPENQQGQKQLFHKSLSCPIPFSSPKIIDGDSNALTTAALKGIGVAFSKGTERLRFQKWQTIRFDLRMKIV